MLRRLLTLSLLVILGAALPVAAAGALPITSPYPAPVLPTVSAGVESVEPGGFITMSGSGFLPGEPIDITVEYSSPSGLRRNAALIELAAAGAAAVETQADENGAFVAPVQLGQVGIATITATGRISGFSISQVVRVGVDENGNPILPPGGSPTTTPVAPAPGGGSGGGSGGDQGGVAAPAPGSDGSGGQAGGGAAAAPGAGTAGSASGEPLASTGASVAGPLAVGAALLAAGLLMLFFGTRLVIRRRVRPV